MSVLHPEVSCLILWSLVVSVAYSVAGTFVQIVRITAGRPRPGKYLRARNKYILVDVPRIDFIARCNPSPGSVNLIFSGLANVTICQTSSTDPIIKDGMRSFFSGHAILSAVGFGYISLYWSGKLHIFDQGAHTVRAFASHVGYHCLQFTHLNTVQNLGRDYPNLGVDLGMLNARLGQAPPLGRCHCRVFHRVVIRLCRVQAVLSTTGKPPVAPSVCAAHRTTGREAPDAKFGLAHASSGCGGVATAETAAFGGAVDTSQGCGGPGGVSEEGSELGRDEPPPGGFGVVGPYDYSFYAG